MKGASRMSERNVGNRSNGMSLWTELQMQMTVVLRHREKIPNVPRHVGSGAHAACPVCVDENVKQVVFIRVWELSIHKFNNLFACADLSADLLARAKVLEEAAVKEERKGNVEAPYPPIDAP